MFNKVTVTKEAKTELPVNKVTATKEAKIELPVV